MYSAQVYILVHDIIGLFKEYEDAAFSSSPAGSKVIDLINFDISAQITRARYFILSYTTRLSELEDILKKNFIPAQSRSVRFAIVQSSAEKAFELLSYSLSQDVDLIILNIPTENRSEPLMGMIQNCVEVDVCIVDLNITPDQVPIQ